jgi:hypothetical protein
MTGNHAIFVLFVRRAKPKARNMPGNKCLVIKVSVNERIRHCEIVCELLQKFRVFWVSISK